ncbi:MAG: hypothetical protein WC365_04235 [Candidatus Babeliales bacterium]|jgi:hypothetical protein
MNDPAVALCDYIETNYSLATAGVTKSDVEFTTVDYNTELSPQKPHIIVITSGFRRLQEAEPNLYEFTFLVQIALYPEFRKAQTDIEAIQKLYWEIVNHVKLMIDGFTKTSITGWQWAIVDSGANAGILLDTVPNTYIFNLSVKALIAWSA